MVWFNPTGNKIVENTLANDDISPISHSLCKLIVALGDHSTSYIAQNISSVMPTSAGPNAPPTTKGHLTQNFLRLLLAYTGLPGYYGVDEEESEMTLGFWYLFQEALWSTNLYANDDGRPYSPSPEDKDTGTTPKQVLMAKAVFSELVQVLRRKVAFPPAGSGWSRGGVFSFCLSYFLETYRYGPRSSREIPSVGLYYCSAPIIVDESLSSVIEETLATRLLMRKPLFTLSCLNSNTENLDIMFFETV